MFLIFGWVRGGFGNGFGGNGGGYGGVPDNFALQTDFATIERKLDSSSNGICDSTFNLNNTVTLQVFQGTEGIPTNAEVVFLGKSPSLKVSEQLAGRFFNAFGDPIDGGPEIEGKEIEIGGPSVNPVRRKQPSELIATGIAGIDLNNTLVSGH